MDVSFQPSHDVTNVGSRRSHHFHHINHSYTCQPPYSLKFGNVLRRRLFTYPKVPVVLQRTPVTTVRPFSITAVKMVKDNETVVK